MGAVQAGLRHRPAESAEGGTALPSCQNQNIWPSVEGLAPSLLYKVKVSCSGQSNRRHRAWKNPTYTSYTPFLLYGFFTRLKNPVGGESAFFFMMSLE